MKLQLHGVDERLSKRYQQLVQEHTGHAHAVASGPRHLPGPHATQAGTQAAWRFYHNPRLSFPQLVQPLLQAARHGAGQDCRDFALAIHDWSVLSYPAHTTKADRIPVRNDKTLGYELFSSLLVSDRDGQPLAPLLLRLRAAAGVYTSQAAAVQKSASALDELEPIMDDIRGQHLGRPVVHLIDREADSVWHYRRWHQAGHRFVVRADDERLVRHAGEERRLPAVVAVLRAQGSFRRRGLAEYQGRRAEQFVAEATVTLERPARLQRVIDGRKQRHQVRGEPLTVRLVVSEIRDADGAVLSCWLLLTNVPDAVAAETIALWYYWRWQVESYFKLLKGAGQHVEAWQQEKAAAVLRRLLVASMACVLVWRLARSAAPRAEAARALLVRLSGRQMAWGKAYTDEALLAGLWVLLAMLEVMESQAPADLRGLADFILSGSREQHEG